MSAVIVHFLNLTEHLAITAALGRHLLAEFEHIPLVNSAPVYFMTNHDPCYFNHDEIFDDSRGRHCYQNFNQLDSIVIFLGNIPEQDQLERIVRVCYPWVAIMCNSGIRRAETLRCCDAFYERNREVNIKVKSSNTYGDQVILLGVPQFAIRTTQVCNRCGPWLNFSSQTTIVASRNTVVHIRVPNYSWVFKPNTDHSMAFDDVLRERDLPYCNQILKVLSQRFNMSFKFELSRHETYGQDFVKQRVGNRMVAINAWEGGLNAILKRRSMFAIGSVTVYAKREQFFSRTKVFLIDDVLLLNRARKEPFSGRSLLDCVETRIIFLYIAAAAISSVVVYLQKPIGCFNTLLIALILMPVTPTVLVPGKRVCLILAMFRFTTIIVTTHMGAHVLDLMMSNKVLFAYQNLNEVTKHFREFPKTTLWGYSHIIDAVQDGLSSMKKNNFSLSQQDKALCELLTRRQNFSTRPENSKVTIYAGGSENDFIMDEQSSAAYHMSLKDLNYSTTYMNRITALNNMQETIMMQKGCTLTRNFSDVLQRLEESGYIKLWRRNELESHKSPLRYKSMHMKSFVVTLSRHFFVQVVLGSIVVLIELAVDSWRSDFLRATPD